MGVVYDARQIALRRRVALKMVTGGVHSDPLQHTRFQIEAQAVAALQHPHIVQIYEVGEHNGIPFFSLELVEGGSLESKIKHHPLSIQDAARMVQHLAEAMHYAHQHGIVHRDLKPGNVLLTSDGQPKISDFGLAKRIDDIESSQTQAGTILGTPSYMAPEQAEGDIKQIGPLADVYALGATLYRLLTGKPPFAGATLLETLESVRLQEPTPLRQLQPKIPRDLETICLTCLQKLPSRRYADADALARDLKHFLAGEPIEARPVGSLERVWRWCRRHPAVASLTAAVFTLLATVAVTSSVLLVRVANEKDRVEEAQRSAEIERDKAQKNAAAAREAETKANENALLAAEQGRLAVGSLYRTVTEMQRILRDQPGIQKQRMDLLSNVFADFKKVVDTAKDSPLAFRTRAAAYQHMGDISKDLGKSDEALKCYKESQKIIDAMIAADPQNDVALWNLSVVNDRLGDIYFQILGDAAVARDYAVKSLEIRKKLAAAPQRSPELKPEIVKRGLANVQNSLSHRLIALGDPASAWEPYREYLQFQLGQPVTSSKSAFEAAMSTDAAGKKLSADVSLRLGHLSFLLRDVETARNWYKRGLELNRSAYRKNPDSGVEMQNLAAALAANGDFELKVGNASRAQELYSESHVIFEKLAAKDSVGVAARENLARSHYRLATAFLRQSSQPDADRHYQACRKLREALAKEDEQNALSRLQLILILARCGQHAEASRRAEALRTAAPRNPAVQFDAACTYALCFDSASKDQSADPAQSARYATLAVEALTAAVDCGYRDAVTIETDPDLDPIRSDSRFREIVGNLQRKS
jgi:serine/threonine-protein kinase